MLFGVVDPIYWQMVASKRGFERIIAVFFFFGYIVFIFMIVLNIFLAILNDAYAGVKYEMEQRNEARRELLASTPKKERKSYLERMRALSKVARGRYYRFSARVGRVRRRNRKTHPTALDVVGEDTLNGPNS
uniref:Ion transport domain-containing protein n=1 Tax=Haptolina ericina TaxID=156174 RepID=A0A7S3ESC7_9EUKA|mmetsp:Transcript_19027/g.42507  ORF Transcript_19027/g.42507 Transcript_19027/m.42507 type:complete len:132 (+) Transcript_19027:104-499(+)